MTSVRVASFNIRTSWGMDGRNHWLLRRQACVETIRSLDADVTGLQEVRPGQFGDLRRAFTDGTITGTARDTDGGGERAAILVRGGRWLVESSETRWLSTEPDRPGSRAWGADHPRVVTLARLRCGEHRLGVANTHFDHASASAREHSAELLARWTSGSDHPWVITGDLNVEPDAAPVRTLLAAGFTDAHAGIGGGTEHAFTGSTERARIDFVLAGPGVRVTSARIDYGRPGGRMPSDHWPVVADLEI